MRPRATILVKLLVAVAAPTLALFALFAYVALEVTREDLDDELGVRLQDLASSASVQLDGKYLSGVERENKEDERWAQQFEKLRRLTALTGARYYVFDASFHVKVDTALGDDDEIDAISEIAQLNRYEIERVLADGVTAASFTFEGDDGEMYKSGFAPVRHKDAVVLVIAAEAPAGYFDRLHDLRRSLMIWGAVLAAVMLGASIAVAVLITRPVRVLAGAAERIGKGDLEHPVTLRSHDELGLLAETMDRMRGQLRERDARMQQMLAGIAHEVRNPLAGMTLFTGILRDELPDGDERRGHVEKIARELGYLERVVSEFLEYARRPAPELAPVELRPLLDEVAQLVAADAERAGVAVEVDADGVALRADAGQLRRALLNLARNAVQAAEPGTPVRLVGRAEDGRILLDVINRGPSIAAEAR
jgi:signal transduction histidine kinase